MKIEKIDKEKIMFRVIDTMFEKLGNELDNEIMELDSFEETNDDFLKLHSEMTREIIKEMYLESIK
tara:strand:+ start:440 stop:637 length:198 start_codon:yes stop_codon:yes gene_type:complete